jgi:N-formylglutamate deformylase
VPARNAGALANRPGGIYSVGVAQEQSIVPIEHVAADDAFVVLAPAAQTVPLLFASPHSGTAYRADFIAAARLDRMVLRQSEDSFVDEIFAAAPAHGAPLLAALFPRAYCDVNREPWELDPAMFEGKLPDWVNTTSPRVGAGLGTIARIAANGEAIYGMRLPFAEAEHRVRRCWQPYHDSLSGLIEQTRARFGACLLIDCHSMPSHAAGHRRPLPDIVLGDAHGSACSPAIVRLVEALLSGEGYQVRRNDPYAGGYVTRHYGRPAANVHVLQIEIARRLYMDEPAVEKSAGFAALAADMTGLIASLAMACGRLLNTDRPALSAK